MPKYHFHVMDGKVILDGEGTELPDLTSARAHAVEIAASLLRGGIEEWPSENGWRVVMTDAERTVLGTMIFKIER